MPRVSPRSRLLVPIAAALLALGALAGCGDDEGSETPATTTTSTSGASGTSGAAGADALKEDAQAKSDAASAQTALESYALDNGGSYEGATPENLDEIESVTTDVGVKTTADTYEVTADSNSGNTFTIERSSDAKTTKTCTEPGVGGCPENGEW
jgi:hypothetical protein